MPRPTSTPGRAIRERAPSKPSSTVGLPTPTPARTPEGVSASAKRHGALAGRRRENRCVTFLRPDNRTAHVRRLGQLPNATTLFKTGCPCEPPRQGDGAEEYA